VLAIVSMLTFGLTAAYLAKRIKRNPYIWFFLGSIFKIYALAWMLFLQLIAKILLYAIRKKISRASSSHTQQNTTIETTASHTLSVTDAAEKTPWYYLNHERKTIGPMSFTAFCAKWKSGEISTESYIWNETLTEWTLFKELFPSA